MTFSESEGYSFDSDLPYETVLAAAEAAGVTQFVPIQVPQSFETMEELAPDQLPAAKVIPKTDKFAFTDADRTFLDMVSKGHDPKIAAEIVGYDSLI